MCCACTLETLSTVGVDLGIWKYRKDLEGDYLRIKKKGNRTLRCVTFYTWDFGGQVRNWMWCYVDCSYPLQGEGLSASLYPTLLVLECSYPLQGEELSASLYPTLLVLECSYPLQGEELSASLFPTHLIAT